MFCPICGEQQIQSIDTINGELFVAEDLNDTIEYYDDASPYECLNCKIDFYVGALSTIE